MTRSLHPTAKDSSLIAEGENSHDKNPDVSEGTKKADIKKSSSTNNKEGKKNKNSVIRLQKRHIHVHWQRSK